MRLFRSGLGDGLKIVDYGTGLAGGLVGKMFVDAGATVTRVVQGPDPFAALYPAYETWQRGKIILGADRASPADLETLLAAADVCVLGGEDHPDSAPRPEGAALAARHPNLVVLEILAEPDAPNRPAVDFLAQVRSGYAYEHSSARPIHFAFPLAAYAAAMQGMVATLAALCARAESGRGELVSTSLLEGGLMWCAPLWFEAERPTRALMAEIPRDVQPLIFRCADGRYIHFMMGTPGAVAKLYKILGIDDPTVDPNDRGMPTGMGEKKNFWGKIELIQAHMVAFRSDEILQALWANGIGAERVEPAGACWGDAQVVHNGTLTESANGVRAAGFPIQSGEAPRAAIAPAVRAPRTGQGPLAGIKVCDLGSFVAGPYLSVLLGDLGADVIKIEGLAGDVNRALLRAFACTNRGKRSISIDLKSPRGAEIVRRLCLSVDVVHHNSRPGVSNKLGIDAITLQGIKPELVVEETSGYGLAGPKAQHAGFDMLFQAFCGHEHRGSGEGDVPLWNRSAIVDFGAGLLGAIGVLFALLKRRRGEAPPPIFVNLLDTGLYLMSELIQTRDGAFAGAPRMNRALTGPHPAERLYEVADGWIAVVVRGEAMAKRLAQALALDSALAAPLAAWNEDEGEALAGALAGRKVKDVATLLSAADVWHEIAWADRRDQIMAEPKLQACGIILRSNDPAFGDFRQIGPAFRFSRGPLALDLRGRIPERGQHTSEILVELGYSTVEIASFIAEKAVA